MVTQVASIDCCQQQGGHEIGQRLPPEAKLGATSTYYEDPGANMTAKTLNPGAIHYPDFEMLDLE